MSILIDRSILNRTKIVLVNNSDAHWNDDLKSILEVEKNIFSYLCRNLPDKGYPPQTQTLACKQAFQKVFLVKVVFPEPIFPATAMNILVPFVSIFKK